MKSKKFIEEFRKRTIERNTTHGMGHTIFYKKYKGINNRCNNPNDKEAYGKYGAKGTRNLWNKFEDFRDDMYQSYLKHVEEFGEKDTTIDRIDNKGHYCKENCRWATRKEQMRNTTTNRHITHEGRTMIAVEWAEELQMDYRKFMGYLYRGLSIGEIIKNNK